MARATATIRNLKNKDTGIDLTVTSIKEVKALIGSTFEYEVMVVSNLACFKNAKHKETDNVQFTVQKKFSEFEDLYIKLNTKYTGTVFPQLPKKVIKVSGQVAKDRRHDLEQFLKFLAMTDKLSSCPLLLEFLGVSSVKAGNFRKPELLVVSDKTENTETDKQETDNPATEEDLFDDDNADDVDDDLFSDPNIDIGTQDDTKIFGDMDLGGGVDEEEDSDLFVPDARSEVKGQVVMTPDEEETDDLLNIDNDLEDLMKLGTKPAPKQAQQTPSEQEKHKSEQEKHKSEQETTTRSKPALSKKPSIPSRKPELSNKSPEKIETVKQKPNLPTKPKPVLPQKPTIGQKPSMPSKPDLKPKPTTQDQGNTAQVTGVTDQGDTIQESNADLSEDDIMKYIHDNDTNNNDDLDLFS